MAYTPINQSVLQYINGSTNQVYSGAVLKTYLPTTTTLLQMATDSTGGTLINDVALNSDGNPEVSGNVIIPHVNQNYKLSLYPTQAAADADTGAIWTVDDIPVSGDSASIVDSVSTIANLRDYTGVAEIVIAEGSATAGDYGGGLYRKVTGAPASTYVDNGNTIIVPTGGDGSEAWLATFSGIKPVTTGTGAAYTVADFPDTLVSGTIYEVEIHTANTGACTLTPGAGSAVNIRLLDGNDPSAGQLEGVMSFLYNGTNLIVILSQFLDRSNHTGTQAMSTISDLDLRALDKFFWPTMENAADTDHDITINSGRILSHDGVVLNLTSAITKQIDAAWAVGTNNGGLFTGTVAADTTYHLFLIRRDSDGLIDAGFDTSITAANIPSGYTSYRRVMSHRTDSSSNLTIFTQKDDTFYVPPRDAYSGAIAVGTAGTLVSLSVPTGFNVEAILTGVYSSSSGISLLYISHANQQTESAVSLHEAYVISTVTPASPEDNGQSLNGVKMYTNDNGQVRFVSSTASNTADIGICGWVDTRAA